MKLKYSVKSDAHASCRLAALLNTLPVAHSRVFAVVVAGAERERAIRTECVVAHAFERERIGPLLGQLGIESQRSFLEIVSQVGDALLLGIDDHAAGGRDLGIR